jgi:hypothetical protein
MKRKANSQHTIYIVVLFVLFTFLANCGSDSTAPADPSSTSEIPDIVFFNTIDPSAIVLFAGRATDNTRVETVLISFNNGAIWHTADIDSTPPNKLWDVEWSYPATSGDIPAAMNTVLIRALDGDANEVISSPIPLEKQFGPNVSDFLAVFTGPSAALSGDVVGLSSGVGGAYGNGTTGPNIPINVPLTVIGSGYGNTITSGHPSFPAVMSTATIIEWPVLSASIFSVDADLTLKNIRLLGAENAVRIFDSSGPDPQLTVENCVFDGQGAWAVYAEDDDQVVDIRFLDSIVDASQADSSSRGGLFLDNVAYQVEGSGFYYHTDPGGPTDSADQGAAVQVVDGAGEIIDSIFENNSLAIWASGGEAVIDSCNISGIIGTTNGILYSGSTVQSPEVRYSYISSNSGFGVQIAGQVPLVFLHNSITGNGSGGADEGGVVIDYDFNNTNTSPILGDCTAFNICQTGGRNSIFDNNPFDVTVTATSTTFIPIDAQGNWWGPNKFSSALVDVLIQDGDSNTIPGPEDDPFNRAFLDYSPWDATNNDPND